MAGLMVAGWLGGAIAAVGAYALAMLLSTGKPQFLLYVSPYAVAVVGGLLGSVLLPLTSWLMLRRVSLAKTLAGAPWASSAAAPPSARTAMAGTVLGGVSGWGIMMLAEIELAPIGGAVAGYFAGALALRAAAARQPRIAPAGS